MSCAVSLKTMLVCAKKLIKNEDMKKCLKNTLSTLNMSINNDRLLLNNNDIGAISITDRIVVTYKDNKFLNSLETLRSLFTENAKIFQKNYIDELENENIKLKNSNIDFNKLESKLRNISSTIQSSEIAMKRQELNSCDALKCELCDAAKEQGYEIIEEKNEEGIQLQFVKIEY